MIKHLLQTAFVLLLFFSYGCQTPAEPASTRPNIIFIMSDDHTSQAWGIYDGIIADYVKNDHIQQLATEGMTLDNVFCTNSICTPSRASIMTGQYSHQNGVYTLSEALEPDSMNIAKMLQSNGYQTAIIGKWHLKKQPSGFDHFNVLPGQGRYHNPILKTSANWEEGGKTYEGFSSDVIGDLSIDWLQQRSEEKPFFLMTHFKATHEPFDYPARHQSLLAEVELPEPSSLYDFGPSYSGRSFDGQQLWRLGERWVRDTEKVKAGKKATYPGLPFSLEGLDSLAARKKIYQKYIKDFIRSGAAIDDNIGKILDYLEQEGLTENTVVIYTADQGFFLGEHGFFDKRMIYEQALRMPFVVRYPKEIAAGSRNTDMILNLDFPSLFADYARTDLPSSFQGRSFRDNLKGQTPGDWRKEMYYRYWLHQTNRPAHFGIRNDRYKLAFFYGQPLDKPGAHTDATPPAWEFYDLQEDPEEVRNAYGMAKYQAVIKEMKTALLSLRSETDDTDANNALMQSILKESWE